MIFNQKRFESNKPYFANVAVVTLLSGAAILALGLVELGFNVWGNDSFASPVGKVIGGLIVLSLGYIHLELELMRTAKK